MKIPERLKILGKTFDVILKPGLRSDDAASLSGACNVTDLEIKINSCHPQQEQESTLLHEILEAANKMLELNLKHSQIYRLEEFLYQVLCDNKLYFGGDENAG